MYGIDSVRSLFGGVSVACLVQRSYAEAIGKCVMDVVIGEGVQEVSPVFSCGSGVHQTLNVHKRPPAWRL